MIKLDPLANEHKAILSEWLKKVIEELDDYDFGSINLKSKFHRYKEGPAKLLGNTLELNIILSSNQITAKEYENESEEN